MAGKRISELPNSAFDKGDELIELTQAGTSKQSTLNGHTKRKWVDVKLYGAVGDGATDDYASIMAAITAAGTPEVSPVVFFPAGVYLVSDEIVVPSGIRLQGVGSTWDSDINQESLLLWGGGSAPGKAVIRLSTDVVGVEPTIGTRGSAVRDMVIHGNYLVGYGVYCAYLTEDSYIERVSVKRTNLHGFFAIKCWYATFRDLTARDNAGCGLTFGKQLWGGDDAINSCLIQNIRAHSNGSSFITAGVNSWTDADKLLGYGIGLFGENNSKLNFFTTEFNAGAGLVMGEYMLEGGAENGYIESNCRNSDGSIPAGTSARWGVIYDGHINSRNIFLRQIFLNGTNPTGQAVWLTGSAPGFSNAPFTIEDIANGAMLKADWGNYVMRGYIYFGLTNYIVGCLPRDRDLDVDRVNITGMTTVYVDGVLGLDGYDGRAAVYTSGVNGPVKTLTRAVAILAMAGSGTTISVVGNIPTETVDLRMFPQNRGITIDGGGVGIGGVGGRTIGSAGDSGRLSLQSSLRSVIIKGFSRITRIGAVNAIIVVQESTVGPLDAGAGTAVSVSAGADLTFDRVALTGAGSTYATPNGLGGSNSKVTFKGSTIAAFGANRSFYQVDALQIFSDVDYGAGNVTYTATPNATVFFSPTSIRTSSRAI